MVWIFAAVVLILLVVSRGFRRSVGGIVAAIALFAVVVQVHDHYEKKAEAETAQLEASQQEPDPCNGIESDSAHVLCLLAER